MGFFGSKKEKVVDLSENYHAARKFAERTSQRTAAKQDDTVDMGFLGNIGSSSSSSTTDNFSWDNEPAPQQTQEEFPERKQKLAKRLLDMTNKIEDLSNQIYHLTQRMELLEKKNKVNYG
jgi:hypothetical protein